MFQPDPKERVEFVLKIFTTGLKQQWKRSSAQRSLLWSEGYCDSEVSVAHSTHRGAATNLLHPHNLHSLLDHCAKEAATLKAKLGNAGTIIYIITVSIRTLPWKEERAD